MWISKPLVVALSGVEPRSFSKCSASNTADPVTFGAAIEVPLQS